MSKSFFGCPNFKLGCNTQNEKNWAVTYPDPHIYVFFEKYARGKISRISNSSSKANNKYLKSYDTKQESKHIIYL